MHGNVEWRIISGSELTKQTDNTKERGRKKWLVSSFTFDNKCLYGRRMQITKAMIPQDLKPDWFSEENVVGTRYLDFGN